MDKFDIIKKWTLFGYNYPNNFIQNVWNDETDMFIMHLQNKFEFICEYDMNKFFIELDSKNQEKLINWVFENYKG
jgi:hypothetical protein